MQKLTKNNGLIKYSNINTYIVLFGTLANTRETLNIKMVRLSKIR